MQFAIKLVNSGLLSFSTSFNFFPEVIKLTHISLGMLLKHLFFFKSAVYIYIGLNRFDES